MSQLVRVEGYARSLKEYCEDPNVHSDEILQTIKEIGVELLSNIADSNIDIICSVLFEGDGPVFRFLDKCKGVATGDLSTAATEIFKILCTFIKGKRHYFQKYATRMMNYLRVIAKSGGNALCRCAAFDVIIVLLDKTNQYDTTEFDVPKLYQVFEEQYTGRASSGVKAKIMELLGIIARYFPSVVDKAQINRLKRWCFDNLRLQLSNISKAENTSITGYMTCLDHILYRDDDTMEVNSEESEKLFQYVIQVLDGMKGTLRYAAPISALVLFRGHCKLFTNFLLPHYDKLYDCLYYWASHHNRDSNKFGLNAYEEFLRQLSVVLYHNIEGEREYVIFHTFMIRFNKTLEEADNLENMYHVSVAIRGIGYFAKILTKVKDTDVDGLRNSLVKISEWLYSDANEYQDEYIRHLPAFIKSYTSFAEAIDIIPASLMDTLHQMCKIFIEKFPKMTAYLRRSGTFYIYQLINMLYRKGEGVCRNFMSTFFERALVYTCTNIHKPDSDDLPTYTELLYFWRVILSKPTRLALVAMKSNSALDGLDQAAGFSLEDTKFLYATEDAPKLIDPQDILEAVYDTFIATLMKVANTLNLQIRDVAVDEDENEPAAVIISKTLRPVNQKDFILFQNLVDFWGALLREIDNARLLHWLHILGSSLIELSVLHPMISGFYKMFSGILTVCAKERWFLGCEDYYSRTRDSLKNTQTAQPEEFATYLVFRDYVKEVWHRLQQFTDDLLASCLQLVLAYCTEFFNANELVMPLEKALHLGITYHPLAVIAMDSLDTLLDPNLDYNIDANFLSRILPCINEYLLIGVSSFSQEENQVKSRRKAKVPTAADRKYQAVHIKMTMDEMGVMKQDYAGLPELQRRMMQFLGRLGGKNKQLLDQGKEAIEDNGMLAWDPVKKLKLRVPFMNVKVNIYLDEFLPRICELAQSSPDRQVKIAACELLHGLVTYMIGSTAFAAKATKAASQSLYHRYYERVFPVMLKLAIDSDNIARNIYRPFYSQVIHWLTNNAHAENPETIALLQSLLDASCDADAGLRDYGAECIQEFVQWSIKQTSRSSDGTSNIKSLLKRLYNLMISTSTSKRFGASLVFNRIYKLFREEPKLVDEYTVEILGQLFLSLKIAEADHPSIGTKNQIGSAISHIKRIIREKRSVFLANTKIRPFISDPNVKTLPDLVYWTFVEGGSLQRSYAKVCITFFSEFVLFLPKTASSKQWLESQLASDPLLVINAYETEGLHPPRIEEEDETDEEKEELSSTKAVNNYLGWLRRLNSTLDGYVWLVERDVIDPESLLKQQESQFMLAVDFFLRNTPQDYLEEQLDQQLVEKNKIMSIYTFISTRLIYFFDLVFGRKGGNDCFTYTRQVFSHTLYHTNFMENIAHALLLPKQTSDRIASYEANKSTNSSERRVFDIAKNYINTMLGLEAQFMSHLVTSITNVTLSSHVDLVLDTHDDQRLERSSLVSITQTVHGIKYLQSIDALDIVCRNTNTIKRIYPPSSYQYSEALFNSYLHGCAAVQEPLHVRLLGEMLLISFAQPGFAQQYASQLLAFSGILSNLDHKEKADIFQRYDRFIVECITNDMDIFSVILKQAVSAGSGPEDEQYKVVHDYIFFLLEYLKKNRINKRAMVWKLTDYLIKDPSLLEIIIDSWNATDDQLLDTILFLKLLFEADPGLLSRSKRSPLFDLVWRTFMSLLRNSQPRIRIGALDLLPMFICMDKEHIDNVMKELQVNCIDKLPPVQGRQDIKEGTVAYTNIVNTLDKLLTPMVTFKSVALFDLLKVTFIQEQDHVYKEAIDKSIDSFSKDLGLKSFLEITQSLMNFFKNTDYNLEHRQNIARILLVLLKSANENHVVSFYERNVCYLMSIVCSAVDDNEGLYVKACCLDLMRAFYNLLPKAMVDKKGPMDNIWLESSENLEKKNMIINILAAYQAMIKHADEDMEMLTKERKAAVLEYNRQVFNALAAYALRVSENGNLSTSFFSRDSRTQKFLWDQLVDTKQRIYLKLELDHPMVSKKLGEVVVSSNTDYKKDREEISYMASMDIEGSSLTQASLSQAVLEEAQKQDDTSEEHIADSQKDTIMAESWEDEGSEDVVKSEEEVEFDIVNQNTFMITFTELIKKLHTTFYPPGDLPTKMPNWMAQLLRAFSKCKSINIRVFIAKLITNYPEAFEKFADEWTLPLMEFMTKGNKFGEPINYLIQDLCVIINIWGKQTPLKNVDHEGRAIVYKFLKYLISNANHPVHRITRSNIRIIKTVYENWGKLCHVPTRTIYEQFCYPRGQEAKNIIGLQMVGIVYSNGAYVYDDQGNSDLFDLSEVKFFTDMAANLRCKSRKGSDVSTSTAELMSWTLKLMKQRKSPYYEQLRESFKESFINLGNAKEFNLLFFLRCMNRIYIHDLELAQELVSTVTFRLNQANHEEKILAVNYINECWNGDQETYYLLKKNGLSRMLTSKDPELQIVALKAVVTIHSILDGEAVRSIFETLKKTFPNHSNEKCRSLYYAFLKKIYLSDSLKSKAKELIKGQLFKGLIDKDEAIAADMFKFVTSDFEIDDDIGSTLLKITGQMYLSETEEIYLLYATRILLYNTKKTYDFNEPIFQNPLAGASFDDTPQKIDTTWQASSSMQPLFSSSQAKERKLEIDDLNFKLKKTQSLIEFSDTQGTNSSLYFSFNPEHDFEGLSPYENSDSDIDQVQGIPKAAKKTSRYTRKRFFESSDAARNRFHANRNEQLQKTFITLLNFSKEAMEKKVVMTRTYKVGPIPDVQIAHKDLLLPLEALATADYNISRLLYSNLAVSIVNEMRIEMDSARQVQYQKEFIQMLANNLKNSQRYHTPTIGSLLRIVFDLNAFVPASLVKTVSSKSDNHHIGIAILEKQLLSGEEEERPHKKTSKLTLPQQKWIHLSLLYQNIDELEIFESVYLANVATDEDAKEGIKKQIQGEFALAFNHYYSAMENSKKTNDIDTFEYNLWREQMLYCRTQLGQWDRMGSDTKEAVNSDWNSLWEDNEDPYLEYFIRSYSKASKEMILTIEEEQAINQEWQNEEKQLRSNPQYTDADIRRFKLQWERRRKEWKPEDPNPIYKFLDDAYQNDVHKERLLDRFACDWSIVEILRKNYSHGRLFIGRSYDALLAAWTTLHPLAYTSRLARLSQLQRVVETEDYLLLHKKIEDLDFTQDQVVTFIKALSSRHPDYRNDRMDVWDEILWSRLEYLNDLQQNNLVNTQELAPLLDTAKNKFVDATTDAALTQKNTSILSKLRNMYTKNGVNEKKLSLLRFYQLACSNKLGADQVKVTENLFTRSLAYQLPANASQAQKYDWAILFSQTCRILKDQFVSDPLLFDSAVGAANSTVRTFAMKRHMETVVSNADTFVNYLEETGYKTLMEANDLIDKHDKARSEYLWRLGNYCDNSLHILRNKTSTLQPEFDVVEYAKVVIENYFKAIDLGHAEATSYFPRLLELIELYPEAGETFKIFSLKFEATWKYIRWIPQLVSSINGPISPFIFPALERLAKAYPNALYYPMQISYEFHRPRKHKLSAETCRSIDKIMSTIRSPLMEILSRELSRLTHPEHIARDFVEYIRNYLTDREIPQSFITHKFNEFYELLLDKSNSKLGSIPKGAAIKHAAYFLTKFGNKGTKIPRLTRDDIKGMIKYARDDMKTNVTPDKERALVSYSPFLSSFKGFEHTEEIEVPGQYDGLTKPYPEMHAKIASFDSNLMVMSSMRKPKRIKILGTDEKEYLFLIKGGEDLRLDERIEQAFSVMNNALRKDAFCARQNMQIPTYKVVPMSTNLGIIEWVNNTKPLLDCMETTPKNKRVMEQARIQYRKWIASNGHSPNDDGVPYRLSFGQPRERVVTRFHNIQNMVPSTMLKDYLFSLASSPEAFLFSRKEFAYSLACNSIFLYILGVGDRHLFNFLLDLKSGRIVPIDFGYAFGFGAELRIPEFMPFRLTRQLISVLEPLGVSGILEDAMAHVLKAVQTDKELLLNIMRVFVNEPHMEWRKEAKKQQGSQEGEPGEVWYPQAKIDKVRRKLELGNPAYITEEEIALNPALHDKRIMRNARTIVKGDPKYNFRAQVGPVCQDVNEQIRCLIDQATDPRIMGVTWHGWCSFF